MSSKTLLAVISAGFATLVAGLMACGEGPVTTVVRRTENTWAIAQGAGVLPLFVAGTPVDASAPAVEDAVLRAVRAAMTWTASPPVMLAPASSRDAGSGIHLVFVFNGDAADSCTGKWPVSGGPRPDGRITLQATLCDGAEWLARVDGKLAKSEGLDDRRLRKLIGQATRELLAPPAAPHP
jgi:hypothetical protein